MSEKIIKLELGSKAYDYLMESLKKQNNLEDKIEQLEERIDTLVSKKNQNKRTNPYDCSRGKQ